MSSLYHSFRVSEEKPRVTWASLRRVLLYAAPYSWFIAGMLLLTMVTAGLALLTPMILRDLIDRTLPARDLHRLGWLVAALVAIPLLSGALNVLLRQLNSRVGEGVVYDLRVALFSRLQRMSLGFFTHTKVGELMSRINGDVVGAQNAISNTFVNIFTSLIQAIVLLAVMLSLEWRLTLVCISILPLFFLAATKLSRRLRDIARVQMDLNAKMNAVAHELLNISGALLVKLFGRHAREDERFKQRASEVREVGVQRAITGTLFFVSIGLLSSVGAALVYGVGGYLVIQSTLTIGTIVALGAYVVNLYGALQTLTNAPVDFATSMVSFERVFEVLDLPREIEEKPDALLLDNPSGALEFQHVSFHYAINPSGLLKDVHRFGQMQDVQAVLSGAITEKRPKEEENTHARTSGNETRGDVLDNITFRADPGQLVALVGPSGAGKTTITYLIPRLYDPTTGRILFDGHDLKDISTDSLLAQIGMVTQETYLFHDTIRMNLSYAKPDATAGEIEEATRVANIHDFIAGLPGGYDTVVGERGYRLSGGEKQRLALARVILKNPRILVLDEATSSLDSTSETLIQEALKRVMAGRTSIAIAHRLSTIVAADLILVIDQGKIVERGRHDELLFLGGMYSRLYETQFRRDRG